ncbi:DUF2007 domain-containing protein [Gramella lutea]|uniref:DUF2007 domain-containing protein n=1 Tax=Christiangramia lutea TaxID=1607951 RepID=A0A9X2ABL9_9FLAO|nr:DUF2007 domain-containing protein [Christiangramia lutea]MCH4823497.1 DUF2007 domain-containing protein [Christiangramia lutea]
MHEDDNYKRVYTGPETNVQYLQELFENEGIHSRVRNDFDSGLRAGFGGGLPGQVLLFVLEHEYETAVKIARSTFPKDFENE